MPVRKAVRGDFPRILNLARSCGLDYEGLDADEFWLVEEGEAVAGIVGLQRRPDGLELVSLGVDPAHRGRGLARALVEALCEAAGGDVYLSTVIPHVFARLGFEPAARVPASVAAKKGTAWCVGCERARCADMVRRAAIPRFPEFRPFTSAAAPVLAEYLRRFPPVVCELNVPNILIWRESEHPKWTVLDDNLCLLVEPEFEAPYALPPVGETRLEETVRTLLGIVPRLSRVPEPLAAQLRGGFAVRPDRVNYDYVYLVRDLIELRGKKFDGKRNRIHKFETGNRYVYESLRPEHREGCRRLLDAWYAQRKNGDVFGQADKRAILEALDRSEELGLTAAVVIVGDQVQAFTMGSPLNPETALIQIEIANPDVAGLSQWINREFLRREWSSFRFVNREQDLGLPGLRRAKESYYPCHLVEKSDVFLL